MTVQTSPENRKKILIGVTLAIMLSSLDQTIVSAAMPQIVAELNGVSHLSWVFTAYMLTSTITVPVFGKLSDIMGRRGMYLLAILVFLVGSILSGMALSMWQLIFFRGIQGVGGGAMMVSAVATIGDIIPPAQRGRYQGLIGGAFGVSSIMGPLLGGWICNFASWRWIFYINIPLGVLVFAILASGLPKVLRVARRKVDYLGATLLTTALFPFLLALVWGGSVFPWKSLPIAGLIILSIASLIQFVRVERRVEEPIMTFALFKKRSYWMSISIAFLTAMAMYSAIMFVPFFAQGVLWVSPARSGMMMMPMMLGLVASSIIGGQITSRTGRYKEVLVVGVLMATASLWMCTHIGLATRPVELVILMAILGMGLGTTFPIINLVVQSSFDRNRMGEVTAGVQLFRNLGGTIGTAIMGGVLNIKMTSLVDLLNRHPFVVTMRRAFPDEGFKTLDSNLLQSTLTMARQSELIAQFQTVSTYTRESLLNSFPDYLVAVRLGYSQAIDQVFWVGTGIMLVAVVIVFFIPEIPLRVGDRVGPSKPTPESGGHSPSA